MRHCTLRVAIVLAGCAAVTQAGLGGEQPDTSFTYQGLLSESGSAANGVFDFQFALFDAAADGNQVGSTNFIQDQPLTDGRFTVVLDVGEIPWSTNEPRWLEIRVRPGAEAGAYTTLTPRQAIGGAPYSLSTRGIVVDANGDVGIGTNDPSGMLDVRNDSSSAIMRLSTTGTSAGSGTTFVLNNDDPTAIVASTIDMSGDTATGRISLREDDFALTFSVPNGSEKMRLSSAGLAVGTTTSDAKLNVAGAAVGTGYALNVSDSLLVNGNTGFVGVGRDDPVTAAEVFGLHKETTSFVGMYIDSALGGEPFYGYSTGGTARAFTYYGGSDDSWRLNLGGADRLVMLSNGNLGLGITIPQFRLHLGINSAAKPTSNVWTISSDRRLKKNINTIEGALDDLLALHGVTYQWIDPDSQGGMAGTYTGLIAQDVEPVFPEWISEDAHGYKQLTVIGFEGLVVEALRDLRTEKDAEIADLKAQTEVEISQLRAENAELRARLDQIERMMQQSAVRDEGAGQ